MLPHFMWAAEYLSPDDHSAGGEHASTHSRDAAPGCKMRKYPGFHQQASFCNPAASYFPTASRQQ